jgi:excisionase family DNA binding protein
MNTEEVKVIKKLLIEISSHLKDLTLIDNLNNREWLDSSQAAEYLCLTKGELLNKCSQGKITYFKFGRKNLFRRDFLDELILKNRRGPQ